MGRRHDQSRKPVHDFDHTIPQVGSFIVSVCQTRPRLFRVVSTYRWWSHEGMHDAPS